MKCRDIRINVNYGKTRNFELEIQIAELPQQYRYVSLKTLPLRTACKIYWLHEQSVTPVTVKLSVYSSSFSLVSWVSDHKPRDISFLAGTCMTRMFQHNTSSPTFISRNVCVLVLVMTNETSKNASDLSIHNSYCNICLSLSLVVVLASSYKFNFHHFFKVKITNDCYKSIWESGLLQSPWESGSSPATLGNSKRNFFQYWHERDTYHAITFCFLVVQPILLR